MAGTRFSQRISYFWAITFEDVVPNPKRLSPHSNPYLTLMDLQTLVDLSLFFVAYYLVELLIRLVLRAWHPKFFDHLLAVGKLRALTAFCLGVLITLFSAPVCASACMS